MAEYPSVNPYQMNPRPLNQPFIEEDYPHPPPQILIPMKQVRKLPPISHEDSVARINRQQIVIVENPHLITGQQQHQNNVIIIADNHHQYQQQNTVLIAQQNVGLRHQNDIIITTNNNNNNNFNNQHQQYPINFIQTNNNHQITIITTQQQSNQQITRSRKRIPNRQSQPVRYYQGDTYIYPYYYDSSGCYYCCWFNGNCCPCENLHQNSCSPICCDPFPCCNGCTGFHCGCLDFMPCCQVLQCVKNNNCGCCEFLPCCSGCEFCSSACDGACISALPCCNDCQCGQLCQVIPCCNGCQCEHIFGCLPCCNDAICNLCQCLQGCQLCNCIEGCQICECIGNCDCGNIDCGACDGCNCDGCDGCDFIGGCCQLLCGILGGCGDC